MMSSWQFAMKDMKHQRWLKQQLQNGPMLCMIKVQDKEIFFYFLGCVEGNLAKLIFELDSKKYYSLDSVISKALEKYGLMNVTIDNVWTEAGAFITVGLTKEWKNFNTIVPPEFRNITSKY